MKIALLNDTHFGCRNDNPAFVTYQNKFYDEVFFPYLIKNNITINKVLQNKKKIVPILKNYAETINYKGGTQKFIKEVINKLVKN